MELKNSRGGLGGKAMTMFKHSCHFSPGGLNQIKSNQIKNALFQKFLSLNNFYYEHWKPVLSQLNMVIKYFGYYHTIKRRGSMNTIYKQMIKAGPRQV